MNRKGLRIVIFILELIYLIWFLCSSGIEQIIIGLTFLVMIFIDNSLKPKENKNRLQNKALNETFYDAIKFIFFGLFSIVYPSLKGVPYLTFIFFFVIVLYVINHIKIKSEI